MTIRVATMGLTVAVGMLLVIQGGCSKKSIQSGGDAQSSERGMAKSGGPAPSAMGSMGSMGSQGGSTGGSAGGFDSAGSTFPDLSLSSKPQDEPESGGLRGFESVSGGKAPSEERLGGGGTMLAKVEPSESTARQIEDIRREQAKEQAASAEAGLRDVFFGYDSWTITEEGRQSLMQDAQWIKGNPSALVKIEGHCDERGTLAYNLVLGEKRAKAVRNYLVELGVGANRLAVVSYGKERPFCNERSETCYQQNRRGHVVVRSK
ncbi:MAG: Tol-Pal system peptidoglycan-associated lipoprotein PAL [Nitrospira sp.]|nr:MAG: Tol-Pal system peptidoglycan-associated lipoprotein PAL [Nitrospira sp.]